MNNMSDDAMCSECYSSTYIKIVQTYIHVLYMYNNYTLEKEETP